MFIFVPYTRRKSKSTQLKDTLLENIDLPRLSVLLQYHHHNSSRPLPIKEGF